MTDIEKKVKDIVSQLTVEQKASLCSGAGFWHTEPIIGADGAVIVPQIMVTDGPHGVRRQPDGVGDHLGISQSVPATCFPTAATTASSWNRELLREIGLALAEECLQEKVSVLLGPGLNIKRSPLCGRNFEYFSEDPFVSGEMATAITCGIQSKGIGTSVKHFAANSQEKKRLTTDAVVDERALREIYLSGFETVVKKAKPATVMTSYNRLNGEYTSESKRLLTDILRDEWGFEGLVVTDWGACNDRVLGLTAGQDLEMPASGRYNDTKIARAVRSGEIDESVLDEAAGRVITMALNGAESVATDYKYDANAHHLLARKAAAESAVLLKNERAVIAGPDPQSKGMDPESESGMTGILPIGTDKTVAVIGAMAKTPRYQGAGSSRINPTKLDNAWDELVAVGFSATYAAGYELDRSNKSGTSGASGDELISEAAQIAGANDVAIVFAGLPPEYESEGFDRSSLDMPEHHGRLIEAVAASNPNTIVVLHTGAPVAMPWLDKVKSVLLMYLGGQAAGGATVDLLTGKVNPSGKLTETFPLKIEDTPCFGNFSGDGISEEYRESIFVGYRYYDTVGKDVLFPFGFGLSYTDFEYDDLFVSGDLNESNGIIVTFTVTNTGNVAGAEIAQLYISGPSSEMVYRPKKELKGFEKTVLSPGEKRAITLHLNTRSFSYYNVALNDWAVEGGRYQISVGSSSACERLVTSIELDGDGKEALLADMAAHTPIYFTDPCSSSVPDEQFEAIYLRPLPPHTIDPAAPFNVNSSIDDMSHTFTGKLLRFFVPKIMNKMLDKDDTDGRAMAESMAFEMPLRVLMMQSDDFLKPNGLDAIIALANGHPLKAIRRFFSKPV
ncbi:MAG: glycoside hydrolase family 3 C-terminal domain-containing protein [Clostridiales Family XIII bacterium]|jgi:beta-glucosidase|nr:glycoside hydrolase family 3 C-terminal domain-containing protein [Clostridiales Family XIII bacterium]